MATMKDLPVEIVMEIMCACPDIATLLQLSSASRRMRQIWCDNTVHIATAILSISSEDLNDALDFAKLEESLLGLGTKPPSEAGPGAIVRHYLKPVEHLIQCVGIIRSIYLTKLDEARANGDFRHAKKDFNSLNSYLDATPDFLKTFLAIRRLVLGYDHEQILMSAYNSIHELSHSEYDCLYTVSRIIHNDCMSSWDRMGIEEHRAEEAWWEFGPCNYYYGPLSWEFAHQTIFIEEVWRFEYQTMERKREDCEDHYMFFGEEKVGLMYDTYKTPWTKECAEMMKMYAARGSKRYS